MRHRLTVPFAVAVVGLLGCGSEASAAATRRSLGWAIPLGNGMVTTYSEFDGRGSPTAIGIVFSATALDGLPPGSDDHHCINRSAEGAIVAGTHCVHGFEYVIPLPDAAARRADVPFKWVLFNWNPGGHIPPGIYDVPHFDVHFEMTPIAEIFAIDSGPCGPESVRCDQFQIAKKPVPPNYVPADFQDVDAVSPAMGNHLLDLTGSEFNKQPFTRSWIYGTYDGKVIFYEEMVTRSHLLAKPNACSPIKVAKAVATNGFYPTVSCIRHNAATGEYSVSMERFVRRNASAPDPLPAAK